MYTNLNINGMKNRKFSQDSKERLVRIDQKIYFQKILFPKITKPKENVNFGMSV